MAAVLDQLLIARPALPFPFDWKKPDYARVFAHRADTLLRLKRRPGAEMRLLNFYHDHPIHFIFDWGVTFDPRNIAKGLPALMPFVLFPKQVEFLEWVLERWKARERGLAEKSRGEGVSWLMMCLACTLCHFNRNVNIGFGSEKAAKVDHSGDPDCLFWKGRQFMLHLPIEFRGGWSMERDSLDMRILFPETQSSVVGEAGDNIGRGGRTTISVIDEAAFLEHPELIESSLSDTTDCRIDISTPSGPAGSFAERRQSLPARQVFTLHWRDDPRRDEAWYAAKKRDYSPSVIARDYDISYAESLDFQLIPLEWVDAAIDAHVKLGIDPTGVRTAALDVADQGMDENCLVGRHGMLIDGCDSWTGQGSDLYATTQRAFGICVQRGYTSFLYDAVGVGSGVKGDARTLNEARAAEGLPAIWAEPYVGAGSVVDEDGEMVPERVNKDHFLNLKAQAWWWTRMKFENTWRALNGQPYEKEMLLSIDSRLKELTGLRMELVQPTYGFTATGKLIVNKAPEGSRSPNRADALVMANAPGDGLQIWSKLV